MKILFKVRDFLKIYSNKIYRRLHKLVIGKYSARDKEIKYWKKAGIKKGSIFYKGYLDKFHIKDDLIKNKIIGDFGCGPFGGIISVLNITDGEALC